MARDADIAKLKAVANRQCPVTSGAQVSQTLAGFKRACAIKREEGKAPRCTTCKGKKLPEELTIIELSGMKPAAGREQKQEEGMAKDKGNLCESCTKKKGGRTSYGKSVCPSCHVVRISAKNRPEILLQSLAELSPQSLPENGNDTALKTEIVRLEDELAATRKALGADLGEDLVEVAKRRVKTMAMLEQQYLQESAALSDVEAERDDLRRRLAGEDTRPRQELHDLALRIAMVMIKTSTDYLTLADVEMLRGC